MGCTNIMCINKSDLINKKLLTTLEQTIKKDISFIKNHTYLFISSKYGFGITNLFKKINKIKKIHENFNINDELVNIKNYINKKDIIISKKLTIKRLDLTNHYPIIINIQTDNKKNLTTNYKKYIIGTIISELKNKNISIKFKFK